MPTPFSRTLRSLGGERALAGTLWLALALLLLGAWLAWLFLGSVPVYEVADSARLEVRNEVHPVSAVVGGRVVSTRLDLDRPVRAGEIVVELDAGAERLALQEGRARLADLSAQREALRAELAVEQGGLQAHQQAREMAAREAHARAREAQVRAELAEDEARRMDQLGVSGGVAEMDRERGRGEALARRASAQALQLGAARLQHDTRLEASDRRKRIAELQRRVVEVEGLRAVEESRVERLAYLLEQRRIRAAVPGRIGEAADLEVGSVVQTGDRLASIVPGGEVRASAAFPTAALGRIRTGQPARIRLDGFPWAEYGTLRAQVAEVASEPRDGRFRVDFRLRRDASSPIPVEHGLPGSAEVEVERISPFALVLRVAGRALERRRSSAIQPSWQP